MNDLAELIAEGVAQAVATVRPQIQAELVRLMDSKPAPPMPPVSPWLERVYRPQEMVSYQGGLWFAMRDTDQPPAREEETGWQLITNGLADIDIKMLNARELEIAITLADGEQITHELTLPIPEYRGVWDVGTRYGFQDLVTCGGSMWISLVKDNLTRPGTDQGAESWQMAVKRGSQGRGFNYRQDWAAGNYRAGDCVTHKNALYHCDKATEEEPGDSPNWSKMLEVLSHD